MTWTQPNFRNAPTAYLQANKQLQKAPIYYCKFGLVTGTQGTNSQVLPTQFCSAPILQPTMTRQRIMSAPRPFSSQVNPVTFEGTIGHVSFDLADTEPSCPGIVSTMVNNFIMKNRFVTIYRGFQGIPEAYYTPIYAGFISNWILDPQTNTFYTFTLIDTLKMATATILDGQTQLIADWNIPAQIPDGAATLNNVVTVGNNSLFSDGSVLWSFRAPYNQNAPNWAPSKQYYLGGTVYANGNTYTCFQAGTSASTGNGPGGNPTPCLWTYIGNQPAPPWQSNTAYLVGQTVSNFGCTFQCTQAGTSAVNGSGPTVPSTMTVLSSYEFAPATDMLNGLGPRNYLQVGNCLFSYTGITNGNSIGDGSAVWSTSGAEGTPTITQDNTAQWVLIGASSLFDPSAGAWTTNMGYNVGNVVSNGGYLWSCWSAGTSAGVGSGPQYASTMIPTWWPNVPYTVGQTVSNQLVLYVCQQAGTSASYGGPVGTGIAGGNTFTGILPVVVNNNGETPAQSQSAGSTVNNYVLFQGNPIDILLQILMSTGTGSNFASGYTNYDVLPASQGIGIPAALFNLSNIVKLRNMYSGNMSFYGFFSAAIGGLKFIQANILQQAMVFLFTNINGQVDINFPYPAASLDAITLDASNVVGNPQFDAHLTTGGYFYNQFAVNYDYQQLAQYYLSQMIPYTNRSIQSIGRYQEISPITVNGQMITTGKNGAAVAFRIASLGLAFFADPPPVITAKTFDAMHLLNPGAIVNWAHPNTPNYKTGKRGGTIICMVINAAPDYFDGGMTVTLLGIGYYLSSKYARWTAQSSLNGGQFPVWTSATAIQKTYGFWGKLSGVAKGYPGAPAYQSDGSAGTCWGP
jgi:hypothetical protein